MEIRFELLSDERRQWQSSTVDRFLSARAHWIENVAPVDNDALDSEIVGYRGAANLLEHLNWEGYEYGFRRVATFEELVGLSLTGFSKILGKPIGEVSIDGGPTQLAIIAETSSERPHPVFIHEYLVALVNNSANQIYFDDWFVRVLYDNRLDWTCDPSPFPLFESSVWDETYWGVRFPKEVEREWWKAVKEVEPGSLLERAYHEHLSYTPFTLAVREQWEDLIQLLRRAVEESHDSVFGALPL